MGCIVCVASATFWTSMGLKLVARWELEALLRSARPIRGRVLGSFIGDFAAAALLLGSTATLLEFMVFMVYPATSLLGPLGPRVAVPRDMRDVVHAAMDAAPSATIVAEAIPTTCAASSPMPPVSGHDPSSRATAQTLHNLADIGMATVVPASA